MKYLNGESWCLFNFLFIPCFGGWLPLPYSLLAICSASLLTLAVLEWLERNPIKLLERCKRFSVSAANNGFLCRETWKELGGKPNE